jgi:hypothetical protein
VSSCGASLQVSSPTERVRALAEALPSEIFRTKEDHQGLAAWRLSPRPFLISPKTLAQIEALGNDLLAFMTALGGLYTRSVRGTAPSFVAEYLDKGKPESVIKLARQNRFKGEVPGVIRPDLILTEGGFIASELDSIPGGMGFVGAMTEAYCKIGETSIGDLDGMPAGLAAMVASVSNIERPTVAIVVSQESEDYREELRWMAQRMTHLNLAETHVCSPQDIVFTEEALFIRLADGREEKIDVLYRNFELFDLPNVPKSDLMLYAARHNRVKITPPPRAPLEEKLGFALLHHPRLAGYWRKELGADIFSRLLNIFPQTWVLDPRPLPPQAAISGLEVAGEPLNDFMQLSALGKGDRDYVVKPSGFSEMAWGSRGVRIANDLTKEAWEAALREGLAAYETTPHILQRFHKGRRVRVPYLDERTDTIREMDGRVRLCPYYFVVNNQTQLGGILATIAPADKRLIHGMTDAVMAPCAVDEAGA